MVILVVSLAATVAGLVYLVGIYQGLVRLREGIRVAWADIDVLLRQRHDELPALIDSCRRYLQHEHEAFEKVMRARATVSEARAAGDVAAVSMGEQRLRAGIGRLFAVAGGHPQLMSDETFRALQSRIGALEEAIAERRELYNDQVNLNNIRIHVFPDSLVAGGFRFRSARLLE